MKEADVLKKEIQSTIDFIDRILERENHEENTFEKILETKKEES